MYYKEIQTQVLSCEYCEILKNTYFEEHLQMAASVFLIIKLIIINIRHLRPLLNQKHNMEWFLLQRFVDLVRIYFLLIVSRNHSNRVNIILISGYQQIYTGCYPLHNFYFNYMQINSWQNFKDKGYLFTLNLPMTTIIHRISLLRAFFFPVDKSVLLHCRFCLM